MAVAGEYDVAQPAHRAGRVGSEVQPDRLGRGVEELVRFRRRAPVPASARSTTEVSVFDALLNR